MLPALVVMSCYLLAKPYGSYYLQLSASFECMKSSFYYSLLSQSFILFSFPLKIQDEAQDLDEREKALKAKETQKIQQEVRAVKREMEAVLKDFENQLKIIDIAQVNSLVKKSESAIASIIEAHQPSEELVREIGQSVYTPRVGEQVLLKSLGNKLATIVEEPGDDETVLVQYGKIRVRADKNNIRALATNSATGSAPSPRTQVSGII